MIAREGDPIALYPGYTINSINGGSHNPVINDRGHAILPLSITNGTARDVLVGYTPELGLYNLGEETDVYTTGLGADTYFTLSSPGSAGCGDGGTQLFNNNGDFVYKPVFNGVAVAAILRGHIGSLIGEPSSVPVAGGVPQNFHLDVGPTYGNQFYFILATGLGTRPGFPHPLNFAINVPMNYDPVWTAVSQAWVNTALWTNTLGVTDANGVPLGNPSISFNMPPGFPGFQGITVHHSALLFDGALVGTFATGSVAVKLY
jgi:hypothetical protein